MKDYAQFIAEIARAAKTQITESVPDGYYVTGSDGTKDTVYKGFKDSRDAIRHADKKEDEHGRVHTVHHVKGGVIHKQWQFSDSNQAYTPYNDYKGAPASQHIHPGVIKESDDNVIHLKPHGKDGLRFKVMHDVGPKDEPHLKKGEIIHDTHIDDLHDSGYQTHIHEDVEQLDESNVGSLNEAIRGHADDIRNHLHHMSRADGGQSSVMEPKLTALHNDLAALKKKHGVVD